MDAIAGGDIANVAAEELGQAAEKAEARRKGALRQLALCIDPAERETDIACTVQQTALSLLASAANYGAWAHATRARPHARLHTSTPARAQARRPPAHAAHPRNAYASLHAPVLLAFVAQTPSRTRAC
jgi:hypothetical protein